MSWVQVKVFVRGEECLPSELLTEGRREAAARCKALLKELEALPDYAAEEEGG